MKCKVNDRIYVKAVMCATPSDGELVNAGFTNGATMFIDEKEILTEEEIEAEKERWHSKGYEEGLEDAWELAKKIATMFSTHERAKIFGYVVDGITVTDILRDFTPQEALAKLKEYEEKQKEIKVGDVVTIIDKPLIVTGVSRNKTMLDTIDVNGFVMTYKYDKCKKTGKHIDIQRILDELKEQQ